MTVKPQNELNSNLKQFRDALAGLYFDRKKIEEIVGRAKLPVPIFNERLIDAWNSLVQDAFENEKIEALAKAALEDYPDNNLLISVATGTSLRLTNGPGFIAENDADELPWRSEGDTAVEKVIGDQNNLLPISFLEVGLKKSASVARIRLPDGALGTGFLTNNNLLITNNHVLPSESLASQAIVEFNYETNAVGLPLSVDTFRCDPDSGFLTSVSNDWTVVRISGDANKKWSSIKIASNTCSVKDRVSIIQHPAGGFKAIGMHQNLVTSVTETRIQYLTDTMPGSSGSPVFDMNWDLVGVHHSGGWLREPDTKAILFRNEGIAINLIVAEAQLLLGE